ncbi:unnamed protein product, partial [Ixodes pacificus]
MGILVQVLLVFTLTSSAFAGGGGVAATPVAFTTPVARVNYVAKPVVNVNYVAKPVVNYVAKPVATVTHAVRPRLTIAAGVPVSL